MNYAGGRLISRETVATGRSLFTLSFAILLVTKTDLDLSGLALLGVEIGEEVLAKGLVWILGVLWISHLVHWLGDLVSLGKFNTAISLKLSQSTFGGGGKLKGRLEYIVEEFERALDQDDKVHKSADLNHVKKQLKEIDRSAWFHEWYSFFFVVGWHMALPTILAVWAVRVLLNA